MKITPINKPGASFLISLAAAGVLLSIAFVKSSPEGNAIVTKKKVERPFKNIDIAYTDYTVNAAEASIVTYATGSKINIPAGAFVDDKGKVLTGAVQLKYREFHDPADFFVSGIPMTYDSAGTQYQFESAGMLEIFAFQDGRPVFVNPDKKIKVEMVSQQTENKYNIYQFDTVAGNWKFINKDKAQLLQNPVLASAMKEPVAAPNLPVTQALMGNGQHPDPLKPQLLSKENYQFNLDVDSNEFPELSVYKDLQFEVKENEKDFDKSYASLTWNDVSLQRRSKGSYLMTLVKGRDKHTFAVKPVFDQTQYEPAYSQYLTLLAERRNSDALSRKKNDSILAALETQRVAQTRILASAFRNATMTSEKQNVLERIFIISGFGIWNSDCPACLPKGEEFAASYVDSTGKKIEFQTLYLVEKGRNAMFVITGYSRLYYDPTKKNILWAITADNKLAYVSEERFQKLKKTGDYCSVAMKIVESPVMSVTQIKKILNF